MPIVLIIFKCSIFTRSVLLLGSLISPSLSPTLLASLSSSDMITQGGVNTRRAHSWLSVPGRVQTINSGHYKTHRSKQWEWLERMTPQLSCFCTSEKKIWKKYKGETLSFCVNRFILKDVRDHGLNYFVGTRQNKMMTGNFERPKYNYNKFKNRGSSFSLNLDLRLNNRLDILIYLCKENVVALNLLSTFLPCTYQCSNIPLLWATTI